MLNKAILMGRLVRDPEMRYTQNNTPVVSFTLAVNRQLKKDETDFIDIVAWSKTAEFVSKWFTKGMQVAVTGRIQTRNWEDKQGNKRTSVEVVAEEVHFADTKKAENAGQGNSFNAPRANTAQAPQNMANYDLPSGGSDFSELEDDDGDVPF